MTQDSNGRNAGTLRAGRGLALGLLLGAGLGTVVSALLGRPAFLAIPIGVGMVLGLLVDSRRTAREAGERQEGTAGGVDDDIAPEAPGES